MLENVLANNGLNTAFSGMTIVFSGLVLIALAIHSFNYISAIVKNHGNSANGATSFDELAPDLAFMGKQQVPEDELVAISVAIELYRKLHFEHLQSEITFRHGELTNSGWKTGTKYDQRRSISR